jgi:spermidine synthase
MTRFAETLYDAYGQEFRIDEMLFEVRTDHQHIIIFHNATFGRVLVLDGVVQTTEKDEFIYHEMMTHIPILAHGNVKRVLIVGGGDGGMLREVTRHQGIESITQVEIDRQVIDMCRAYLPNHSQGAFDDPRVHIVISDGFEYVKNTPEQFDVIISDSTDPIGPGEALFREDFYVHCKRCLTQGGVLVAQNGVAFMQLDEVRITAQRLNRVFDDWHFYSAAVPTYVGGIMTFAWATDDVTMRFIDWKLLEDRHSASKIATRYYTPAIHRASFALPGYVLEAIGK